MKNLKTPTSQEIAEKMLSSLVTRMWELKRKRSLSKEETAELKRLCHAAAVVRGRA